MTWNITVHRDDSIGITDHGIGDPDSQWINVSLRSGGLTLAERLVRLLNADDAAPTWEVYCLTDHRPGGVGPGAVIERDLTYGAAIDAGEEWQIKGHHRTGVRRMGAMA